MSTWLRVGWLVLLADLVYWIWEMGRADGDLPMPGWQGIFNAITFYGGWSSSLLFS
jgi:hypothetical protein